MVDVSIAVQTNDIQVNVVLTTVIPAVDKTIVNLTDDNGVDRFEIKDVDGFPIFTVDSKGNIRYRGSIGRV